MGRIICPVEIEGYKRWMIYCNTVDLFITSYPFATEKAADQFRSLWHEWNHNMFHKKKQTYTESISSYFRQHEGCVDEYDIEEYIKQCHKP